MCKMVRSKNCLKSGPDASRSPKWLKEGRGRTAACWDAQVRSGWEHGAERPRDPCSTLSTWTLPIYVHSGPLPTRALHTHTGCPPQRQYPQISHGAVESGWGAAGGELSRSWLAGENPVELIHKQQAGAQAPPDVHLRVLTAASALDPELTIDTRTAEMDQNDSQGT